MKAAELMAALNAVEQDHQILLDKLQALKDAVGRLVDPDGDMAKVLDQLREIHGYLATQLEAHMDEEETTLFPLLTSQGPGGTELVARLRQEHAEIRRRREEFANCLCVVGDLEDGPPRMVLWDLLEYGWDLWEFLDDHAHLETQAVHQYITRSVAGGPKKPADLQT
jgi:iron-sulfur cluster repair protein YtfE (RIC family)